MYYKLYGKGKRYTKRAATSDQDANQKENKM
jgi:hypothetical protein